MNEPKKKKEEPEKIDSKKLKDELEKFKKETEDYKNKYLRALADYQNYEKRVQDEKNQVSQRVMSQVILRLLPFLDNLEKAQIFFKDEGLTLIKNNFYKVLEEMGLQEIDVLNKEYNPHLAEVVDLMKGDKDNIVVEVLRKGYMLNDVILRIAQVKVSKKITN